MRWFYDNDTGVHNTLTAHNTTNYDEEPHHKAYHETNYDQNNNDNNYYFYYPCL